MFTRRRGSIIGRHADLSEYVEHCLDTLLSAYIRRMQRDGAFVRDEVKVPIKEEMPPVDDDAEDAPPCGECSHCRLHAAAWGGMRLDEAPTLVAARLRPLHVIDVESVAYGPHRYQMDAWHIKASTSLREARVIVMGLS